MIELKTREHLIYFMQSGLLRLSKYDLRFIQNLQALTSTNNKITTNQVALFEKLVTKYQRQLEKHKITESLLANLTWKTPVVASDPKFTEAYISIDDGIISFRSPFNKKFVDSFKKIPNNVFSWIKEKKAYEATFSTVSLKIIVDASHTHYPNVNYCPITTTLLNTIIAQYENVKYWSPTLVKCGDLYIVAALNTELAEAIKDIPLSNDPVCLTELATYGIAIDEKITNNNPLLEFASTYISEMDIKDIDTFIENLKRINCDGVFLAGRVALANSKNFIADKIKKANIYFDERYDMYMLTSARAEDYKNPVVLVSAAKPFNYIPFNSFKKVIKIKNSIPIDIK